MCSATHLPKNLSTSLNLKMEENSLVGDNW